MILSLTHAQSLRIIPKKKEKVRISFHSHSIVAGGFPEIS
tara:strand:+ start:446 stop:565 length:120 start_codon:yes stop_codon:yes gene_type:complete